MLILKTMKNVIINFCPTGMVPTKTQNPHVPISPAEIIEQTHEAFEMGITIAHLHAREENGTASYKKEIYRTIFEGLRKHCPDLILCASSSGRQYHEFEKRSEVLELKPDMCSLTLSSLNFMHQASLNEPDMIIALAEKMHRYGVIPELECFDLGMINYGKFLIKKGILKGPYYWNLLFGNIAGFQTDMTQIGAALNAIPAQHYVSLAGLGEHQLSVNAMAIASGYGVRVGLEDNLWYNKEKTHAASNITLLKRIHQLMDIHQCSLLTAKELRKLGFSNQKQ
jgi:3-keto-5-aminohexanoate cleavage enzyme